ncbi:MAG: PAS domain S-box protein [Chitinophagaceae bacterium]|nr:MAG: PAS domain S-box protein [Chitinophagaceae bacterium]
MKNLLHDPAPGPSCAPVSLEKLIASIVDVICAFDRHGYFRYVSPSCTALLGYTPEEITGHVYSEFIHPEDIDKTVRIFADKVHDCQTSSFHNRYLHQNGSVVPILWSARWDAHDGLLYCVARDATETLQMEQRMAKAQQIARVANFEYDAATRSFSHISESFYDICGLPADTKRSLTAAEFQALMHPDDRAPVLETFFDMNRKTTSTEYRILRPDGSTVFICHQRELVFDEAGRHLRSIGVVQDITDRKLSELALQQSESRLKALVEHGHEMLGVIDIEGKYTFVAGNTVQHLGYTANELNGTNAIDYIHPDDLPAALGYLQQAITGEVIHVPSFRFRKADGQWAWVECCLSNHLQNEAIGGLVINSKDITKKKEQDDQLRMLSLLSEESPNSLIVTGPDFTVKWVNRTFLERTELAAGEVLGSPADEVLSRLGAGQTEGIHALLQTGARIQRELHCHTASGKSYWMDLQVLGIPDDAGNMRHYLCIGRDSTERKRAEAALQQSEQRFKSLVQNGSDLIIIMEETGRFTYVSENVSTILGYDPGELLGHTSFDYVHPDDLQHVYTALDRVTRYDREPKGVQHRFRSKSGEWIWLESKGANHLGNGAIRGILINARDIHDRVQLQERLRQELLNKQWEITNAIIRTQERERAQLGLELHDNVNQVLTTVKLYNELYMTGVVRDGSLLERSARYLQECIDEIRSISRRLSAPTLGKIALNDSIQELVTSINLTHRLEITYSGCGAEECAVSEELHLAIYRIVQEALNNIIKYAGAKKATIGIHSTGAEICLHIQDDGQGFDAGARSSGIGLTNMKTRAENLHGSFELRTAPGAGCSIRVCFPVQ